MTEYSLEEITKAFKCWDSGENYDKCRECRFKDLCSLFWRAYEDGEGEL